MTDECRAYTLLRAALLGMMIEGVSATFVLFSRATIDILAVI
jgi:hypothetical protein